MAPCILDEDRKQNQCCAAESRETAFLQFAFGHFAAKTPVCTVIITRFRYNANKQTFVLPYKPKTINKWNVNILKLKYSKLSNIIISVSTRSVIVIGCVFYDMWYNPDTVDYNEYINTP